VKEISVMAHTTSQSEVQHAVEPPFPVKGRVKDLGDGCRNNVLELFPEDPHPGPVGVLPRLKLMGSEVGMATAEYAIATLAAVGFAGLLVVILRSEEVRGFLLGIIRSALSLP
jgi:hypothetical protein